MQPTRSEHVTVIAIELAWLLGSWAFSFVVLGALFGFDRLAAGPLDIQTHNSYFVLSAGYAAFPIFVLLATVATLGRGLKTRFKQNSIKAVLGLLGIVWGLLLFLFFSLVTNIR